MKPAAKVRHWPRVAIGPLGNRAVFHCAGDIPYGWRLEVPLPEVEPAPVEWVEPEKRKRGRPRKVAE